MSDRPPATKAAQVFGKVAAAIVLGGGLLVLALIVARVALYLIEGF